MLRSWVLVVALAAACAVVGAVALVRAGAASSVPEAAPSLLGRTIVFPSDGPPAARVVTVVGALNPGDDRAPGDRWAQGLADDLHAEVVLVDDPDEGLQYLPADGAAPFSSVVGRVPVGSDVVVFLSGQRDVGDDPLSLAQAATRVYSAVSVRAPRARMLVVGPSAPRGADGSAVQATEDVLRSAAGVASATYLDPEELGWPTGAQPGSAAGLARAIERISS